MLDAQDAAVATREGDCSRAYQTRGFQVCIGKKDILWVRLLIVRI